MLVGELFVLVSYLAGHTVEETIALFAKKGGTVDRDFVDRELGSCSASEQRVSEIVRGSGAGEK